MKQRFSSLDVKVIAHELAATLSGLRLSNAYDLSSRIFLLKFQKPGQREQLIIDSGFRCHLTAFARTTAAAPSAFVSRLRKFLKTRRVTSIQQIGTDRIIEFAFSDGSYRLFLEFYAGGNIILTDADLKVLALLRRVPAGAGEEEIREGMTYSLEGRQNVDGVPALSIERIKTGLEKQIEKNKEAAASKKNKGKKPGDALRRALAVAVPEFPPALLDHAFRVRQFDSTTMPEDILKDDEKLQRLLDVLEEAKAQSEEIVKTSPSKGYIIAKPAKQRSSTENKSAETEGDGDKENVALVYEDFHPFRPRQFEGGDITVIEIVGFNKAVDDFFSSLESQKLESRLTERELHAQKKIDSARQDHEKRIGGLQQVQELNVRKAQALEANIQRVEEATAAVNGLIAQGMDWEDIAKLIETEQARHNPVAKTIKLPLKLDENTITLLLGEEEEFEDEGSFEDETDSEQSDDEEDEDKENSTSKRAEDSSKNKALSVDVDLSLTAYANATTYYDQKRTAAVKQGKTEQASEAALKRHEKKVQADLKKGLAQEKAVLRAVRAQLWFEKFLYFISSEGYLVLGAKDDTQSDVLYKRHLAKGDAWVHADLNHATHVVIKNKPELGDAPIPPSTLAQASSFCVASSDAWDSKAVMGAWWVDAKNVTKLAPNGEYLGTGLFHITGEKNHLPPAQLLLGFGVMFRVSDSSITRHRRHRVPLGEIVGSKDEQAAEVGQKTTEEQEQDQELEEDEEAEPNGAVESLHDQSADDLTQDESRINDDQASIADNDNDNDGEAPTPYQNPLQGHNSGQSAPESAQQSEDEEAPEEDESAPTETTSQTGTSTPSQQPSKTNLPLRGKQAKKAKAKAKYAWQDEEDRALALQLLGSAKGQEKKQTEAEEKATKAAADAAAKERRREQHKKAQQSGKEAEEARRKRLDGEAPDDADDETETADLAVIENYVGSPLPGDEIEEVLVVCAPWDAIGSKYRWRVKMQPGSQKKGKAVREILGSWERDITAREKKRMVGEDDERFAEEKMLRREGELIKGLKDVEIIGTVPVKSCRVVISGGGKDAGKGKGGGKSARGGRGSKKVR